MVEFQMAKHIGSSLKRDIFNEIPSNGPAILPFSYPNISALVPTFDCEGMHGGGTNTKGESEVVPYIIKLFNKIGCKGTFNFVGKTALEHSDIVREVHNSGNDVWGHGYSHAYLDTSTDKQKEEVTGAIEIISKILGVKCKGWRSPYGIINYNLYKILQKNDIIFGSNWGSSAWGSMPFTPIINGERINIYELPFDDCHFDALVFRKLNLDIKTILELYKSRLMSSRNRMRIFTPLIHPVNLAEELDRIKMFSDFIKFATENKDIWIASCSQILNNYKNLLDFNFRKIVLTKNGECDQLFIRLQKKQNDVVRIFDGNSLREVSMVFRMAGCIEKINCNCNFKIIELSPLENVIILPFDLSKNSQDFTLEIEKSR